MQYFDVELHNYEWNFLQARLDLDVVEAAGAVQLSGTAGGHCIHPVGLPFAIDTDGLAAGQYVENLTVSVSDESPGATDATLTLVLSSRSPMAVRSASVTIPGMVTNVADLLLVISEWAIPRCDRFAGRDQRLGLQRHPPTASGGSKPFSATFINIEVLTISLISYLGSEKCPVLPGEETRLSQQARMEKDHVNQHARAAVATAGRHCSLLRHLGRS